MKVRHTGPEELVAGTDYGLVRRKVVVAEAGILDLPVAVDILDSVEADILAAVEADILADAAGERNLDDAVGEESFD